ncbi:MAG: FecR family protein [Tannerellaceae bacterium]|nr:FecR family protein [Tannerellaceae bacterium]
MDTDLAWHRLHARLQKDGLLDVTAASAETSQGASAKPFIKPSVRASARVRVGVAAAIIALCVGVGAWFAGDRGDAPFITLYNEKGSATLVTTLEDGSVVFLAGDSRLRYPERFPLSAKREVSLTGRAMFDVRGDSGRPFVITTPRANVEVVGTVFDLRSPETGAFGLSVREGEVKVTSTADGLYLYAGAGETVTLTASGSLLSGETGSYPFGLYEGRIRFKDEKLINILRVINNRGTGLTLHTTPSLESRRITVTFTDPEAESVAALICAAFNLLCKREDNTLLITEP